MITMQDISLAHNAENKEDGIVLAFAMHGSVVHILGTYLWFYDLITSGCEVIEPEELPDGVFQVQFVKDGSVVETLECSELLSALLRSEPQIVEVVREPKPPIEELGMKRYVTIGWSVDADGNFTPPEGWINANSLARVLTPEQEAWLAERVRYE